MESVEVPSTAPSPTTVQVLKSRGSLNATDPLSDVSSVTSEEDSARTADEPNVSPQMNRQSETIVTENLYLYVPIFCLRFLNLFNLASHQNVDIASSYRITCFQIASRPI